jgi:hypothetical protein
MKLNIRENILKITGVSVVFMFLVFTSCTNENAYKGKVAVIDIENSIDNYELINLSNYASDLKYIQLETNDSALIGTIRDIVYECDRIYVSDQSESIYVFDNEGKYLNKFNKKGRGPGEYSRLVNFFVNPENGYLYITSSQALLCYDNDFNFVKEIEKPEKDLFLISAKPVSKDIYAMVSNGKRHSIMIVGEDTTDAYFKKSNEREFLGNDYMHKITLFPIFQAVSQIRYLSVLNDTIYTITDDFKEEAVYYLNYGKYKEPEQVTVEDFGSMDMNFISFFTISESNDLIFMYFLLRGLCKEPIIDTLTNQDGIQKIIKSNIGYAVYDKKMNEVKFLLQPIKGLMGFADDLTDGVPFWPRYVNSNNKLISYLTPQKIKNFAESNDTAGESIKNLASKLTENDNPVIIIVTPK